ncbi:MAG: hypothetical protein V1685_07145 [Parcubacteria group bacterium]
MNDDVLLELRKLDITLQVDRNWKERLNGKFTDMLSRRFGTRVSELVQWYLNNLFQRFVWEQKRRVELEMLLAEHCPELIPPYSDREKSSEPPSWFGTRAA